MCIVLVNILPIALCILFFWRMHPVRPFSSLNMDYLSMETEKYFRGLFSLVVVFHHLSQNVEPGTFLRFFSNVGFLSVAVFFFYSGYGLQKSYLVKQEKYKKAFLFRRLPSVLFPYILVTPLYWGLNFINGSCYSLRDIFLRIVKGSPIVSNSWYIIAILTFYVAFWLLMLLCRQKYFLMICGGGVWYIFYTIYCLKMDYGNWWYNATHLLIVGMIFAIYEEKIISFIKKNYWRVMPIMLLLFFFFFHFGSQISSRLPIPGSSLLISILQTVLFVASIWLISLKLQIGNKVLGGLGNISLEIYLLQGLFMNGLRSNILYIHNDFLWCVAVLTGTIVLSWMMHSVFSFIMKKYRQQMNQAGIF